MSRRPSVATAVSLLLVIGMLGLGATPAQAGVKTTFSKGVVTVMGTRKGDNIAIGCSLAGKVQLNSVDIRSGSVACANVSGLVMSGDSGNDQISVSAFSADFPTLNRIRLYGGNGNDAFYGSTLPERMWGDAGKDLFFPNAGNDKVNGGPGRDYSYIQNFSGILTITDTQVAGSANVGTDAMTSIETVSAGGDTGYNTVDGGSATIDLAIWVDDGGSSITGGRGNDELGAATGVDSINGGRGNDRLRGGPGNNSLNGGAGTDTVVEQPTNSNVTLTDAAVTSTGTNDTLTSIETADIGIYAPSGAHTINATGFNGPTVLQGTGEADTLLGGPNTDVIYPGFGTGNDTVDGNGGKDLMYAYLLGDGTLTDGVLTTTDNGTDTFSDIEDITLDSNAGNITIDASGATLPTTLFGGNNATTIIGGPLEDRIIGSEEGDTMSGGAGDDFLNGKGGNDTCDGGPGKDILKSC